MGLLFIEGPYFAQASGQDFELRDNAAENLSTNPVIDTDKATNDPQEEHDSQDLEQLLKRYNTDQETILKDAHKLHGDSGANEVEESEIDEMPGSEIKANPKRKDALSEVHESKIKSKKKSELIPTKLSNSVKFVLLPLQKLSEPELLKLFDEATIDSPAKTYMNQFPNITKYVVRLIKDTESLPSMIKILEDREKLIWFFSVMILTIAFGIVLKKIMHREGRSFPKAALFFFVRLYIMFGIRVAIVYYFYSKELTPAAKVFKSTFM